MIRFLITLLLLGSIGVLYAQEDSVHKDTITHSVTTGSDADRASKHLPFDTNYIKTYPEYIMYDLFSNLPLFDIIIREQQQRSNVVNHYTSNITNSIGFDFGYKAIGFSLSTRGKSNINSTTEKGKTTSRQVGISLSKHKYYIRFSYAKATGFYDAESYMTYAGHTLLHPYIIRPDLMFKTISISFLYNINNDKYSYKSSVTYTQRQVKSKGGWLMGGGLYYNQFKDNNPIINPVKPYLKDNDTLNKRLDIYFLKSGFGRGINWVILKKFFFNLQAMSYINISYMNTRGNPDDKFKISPNFFFELSSGIGYNSERLYSGFRISLDKNSVRRNRYNYVTTTGVILFVLGYRFNAPPVVKKSYDIADNFVKQSIKKYGGKLTRILK